MDVWEFGQEAAKMLLYLVFFQESIDIKTVNIHCTVAGIFPDIPCQFTNQWKTDKQINISGPVNDDKIIAVHSLF